MAKKSIGLLNIVFGADLRGFDRAMKKAQKGLTKFSKKMDRIGKNLSTRVTLPILALGAATVKMASDFEETDSKFKQVFSSIEDKAESVAQTFKDSFGLSGKAAKTLLSDTGDLLVGFGFSEEAALELSKQVNELAVDLASFTNFAGGTEGASKALTKALVGETESAKSLGIVIRQGTKEYKDRVAAIQKTNGVSILQAKALANLEIAVSQSTKALGDFNRTQDEFANRMRILHGDIVDLGVEFGQILLPFAEKLLTVVDNLIQKFTALSLEQKENIIKWAGIAAVGGPLIIIFGKLALGLRAILSAFTLLANPVGLVIGLFGGLYLALQKAFGVGIKTIDLHGKLKDAYVDEEAALRRLNRTQEEINKDNIKSVKAEIKARAGIIDMHLNMLDRLMDKSGEYFKDLTLDETRAKIDAEIDIKLQNKLLGTLDEKLLKLESVAKATKTTTTDIKGLTTATKEYSDAIDIMPTDFVWGMSLKDDEPEVLEWIPELTKKQKELNAATALFGDVMHNAMMDAANSQENFFQSLFENLKKAIKQMLIQLAVLTAINIMLGGKGGIDAFNLAKTKLLGFANGGLVTGPTMALVGEGSGTSMANPEVIAPLDKLKSYIGGGDMRVTGRLVGNDIFLSNEKAGVSRNRFV